MNEFYNEIINEKYNSWEFENIISEINKKINTKDSVNYEYDFIKILEDE